MKKNYFLNFIILCFLSIATYSQNVIITGYVDSPCSNANGRTLELYVDGIVDLTGWTIVRQTNGGGFSPGSSTIQIGALGTVSNAFVYITNSSAVLQTEFNITTNVLVNSNINSNGDDGFQVVNNSAVVIDRFGVDTEDATGKDWEHEDTFYYRKDGSTPNAGVFVSSNWTFGALNLLDGKGTCNSSDALSTFVPFGSFKTTAPVNPTISVGNAVSGLDYYFGNGPSTEKTFAVSGVNLTADLVITAPTDFEVSLTSGANFATSVNLSPNSGTVTQTDIYVRLKAGLTVNSYSGDVTASSTGATSKTIALSGIVSPADPQFSFTAFLNAFNYIQSVGGPSAEQSFTVEGLFLSGDIVVTAPTNFEVSLSTGANFAQSVNISPSNGTVAQTTVYVRLKSGLAVSAYSGDITLSSTGLANKTIAVSGNVFGAAAGNLIITGVVDGPLTNGLPKAVEIYVKNNIQDLSLYGLSSVSNGGGSSNGTIGFTFPTGAVTAGSFIYVASETTGFNIFFGFNPTYTSGQLNINGDDSIELYENGQIIDVFGDVNKDGTGEPWEYLDGWAYRKSATGPEATTFTVTNWTYSGIDVLDNAASNGSASKPFPLGTYSTTLSTQNLNINGFAIYPNPVKDGLLTLTSNSSSQKQVEIFSIIGKKVFSQNITGTKSTLNLDTIKTGIYIVKVTEGNAIATQKLVIR